MMKILLFKKAQITIFIILGVAILLSVGLVSFLSSKSYVNNSIQKSTSASLELTALNDYVSTCLKSVASQGVRLMSAQGGYLNPRGDFKYNELGDGLHADMHYFVSAGVLPYLYLEKKSVLRPFDVVKTKLSNYVIVEMQNCLNFSDYEKKKYVVKKPIIQRISQVEENNGIDLPYSSKKIRANVNFNDEEVIVSLSYPILLERDGNRIISEEFNAVIPLRLKLLYDIAEKLLKQRLDQSYELHKHCSDYASPDKMVNIYVRTNRYDYDSLIQIIDAKPVHLNKELPLKFQFAVRNAKITGDCVG